MAQSAAGMWIQGPILSRSLSPFPRDVARETWRCSLMGRKATGRSSKMTRYSVPTLLALLVQKYNY